MTPFFTLPDALPPDACSALVAAATTAPARDGALTGGVLDAGLRRAGLVWLDDLPGQAPVMGALTRAVAQANRDAFGVDLTDFAESAQIARYDADRQGHFGWHSDIGAGTLAARRKLTVVVQLSDPAGYDGGVLEVWPDANTRTAPLAVGTATVFPSFTLHRVTPVTRGTRWSLTLWAHGPAFR